ncbi:MAG TPA: hypothetical protein VK485_06345 [Sphingomicrobium sp.]|nr:hypothetical protein [Sphingomicrobium sp.]
MGFNLRSLSPLLTTAVLVWALLQPLRAEQVAQPAAAPPLALASCDRTMAEKGEQWARAGPTPQVSSYSLNPAIILQ